MDASTPSKELQAHLDLFWGWDKQKFSNYSVVTTVVNKELLVTVGIIILNSCLTLAEGLSGFNLGMWGPSCC